VCSARHGFRPLPPMAAGRGRAGPFEKASETSFALASSSRFCVRRLIRRTSRADAPAWLARSHRYGSDLADVIWIALEPWSTVVDRTWFGEAASDPFIFMRRHRATSLRAPDKHVGDHAVRSIYDARLARA
jgi:hypothetical protein